MIKPQLHHVYKTRNGSIGAVLRHKKGDAYPWKGILLQSADGEEHSKTWGDEGEFARTSSGSSGFDLVEDLGYCDFSIAGERDVRGRVAICQTKGRVSYIDESGDISVCIHSNWYPEPETTEVNGKKYNTKALNERLKELEEIK